MAGASQLQLRRGTTAQHGPFIGAPGEVTVDTDKKTTVVHDGSTAGGFPSATSSELTAGLATKLNVGAAAGGELAGTYPNPTVAPVTATGSTTARTLQNRFADTVNVKDFGAVGDGVADDTAEIQAAINAASSGGDVYFPRGTYLVSSTLTITANKVRLLGDIRATLTYTTPTMTLIDVSGVGCDIENLTINAPAVFDGSNTAITYAVIKLTGDQYRINNCTINNAPKVGIWILNANDVIISNCYLDGGSAASDFGPSDTLQDPIVIDPAPDAAQGNICIVGNIIKRCINGVGSGNTGAASFEQGYTITGNVFENCYGHAVYGRGLGNGHTVSGNACNACGVPIALTGKNHVVVGNTMVTQATGGTEDVTGISLRDPKWCVVSNNSIKGDGQNGGSVIALVDSGLVNSGSGDNEASYNVVEGNVIEITNTATAAVRAINISANLSDANSTASYNVIANNIIKAPVPNALGLIQILSNATALGANNSITGNIVTMTGASGTSLAYAILLAGAEYSTINNNIVSIEYDDTNPRPIRLITVSGVSNTSINGNKVICTAAWGANITATGIFEANVCSNNQILGNTINLDTTKLVGASLIVPTTTSGTIIDHAGTGGPEGVVIAGIGSIWRRTDGNATSPLYIKQSGTSNVGWRAIGPIVGSATYDPPSLSDGTGVTTTVTVTGAAVGDYAEASFSNDLQGVALSAWVSAADTVSVRFQNETASAILEDSATYDPASLNDGDGVTTTVTVTGAALGDFAEASFSLDLQGITTTAWVSAADTVSVRFQNETGGTIDLGSGTLRARVRPAAGSTIDLGSGTLRARVFKP